MREALRRSWNRAGYVEAHESLTYEATALTQGQQYSFRVAAENEVGLGEFVEMKQSVTAKSQFGESVIHSWLRFYVPFNRYRPI